MTATENRPSLDELLENMGDGGSRISEIDSSEAGAGNISIMIGWELDPTGHFPLTEEIDLPLVVPALSGRLLLATGSGRRLRQIGTDPLASVGAVAVHEGGRTATLYSAPRRRFERLTSEFNSHLAVHNDQVARRELTFHTTVHAQPPHLTYLSHLPEYRDDARLNGRLLRWEPETCIALPEGIVVLGFMVPGSEELMTSNVAALRRARMVLWSKHGVMARSDISVTRAVDAIEYVETAARYEYMDLLLGGRAEGLTDDELGAIATTFSVDSPWI